VILTNYLAGLFDPATFSAWVQCAVTALQQRDFDAIAVTGNS